MSAFILFNSLKHHQQAVCRFIQNYDARQLSSLASDLAGIGNSQMDVYTGHLTDAEIFAEIIDLLTNLNALLTEEYIRFLQPQHYQTVVLSDHSAWVLRLGDRENQHIHIHPGRHSPHTRRVKATSLKTAIAVLIWQKEFAQVLDTRLVNHVRTEVLGLSPIRTLADAQAVLAIMEALQPGLS